MIYNKLKEEGMAMGDDVKLTTEITLPPSQISVLKGRGGAMVSIGPPNRAIIFHTPFSLYSAERGPDGYGSSSRRSQADKRSAGESGSHARHVPGHPGTRVSARAR